MSPLLSDMLLRAGAIVAAFAGAALLAHTLQRSTGARVAGALARYRASLDGQLRNLFLPERSGVIVAAQASGVALCTAVAIFLLSPWPLLAAPLCALGPALVLSSIRQRRTQKIEGKLDGLALTLANAMRATPSIGRALELVQRVLPPPLDQEVELVLREMRVGSSVEQSLLLMSARVKSGSLDAVLSGILIGRQVGGNLPEILETSASTLREMGRLEGVLRSKTAESKAQVYVLALFPVILGLGFNTVNPGYFEPLTSSGLGVILLLVAVACWVGSIVMARRILAVEL